MRERRLLIPKERIAPAIGSDGKVKEKIEKETSVKLEFDSESGEVIIRGEDEKPMGIMTAYDTVKAIGRGFSPEKAYELFRENIYLDITDITTYTGKSKKARERLKGRVIGKNGKTRELIEEYTGCSIAIYGKTISCIGPPKKVEIVREAVDMLLDGLPHSAVYNFLEEKKREAEKPLELWK